MATEPPVDDRNDNNSTPPGGDNDIAPISIVEEMKTSYLDYAMSVIVSRALPDVRDGLKPVLSEATRSDEAADGRIPEELQARGLQA